MTFRYRAVAFLLVAGGGCISAASPATALRTTLIRNVLIVDGSGKPPTLGAVRLSGDRVEAIGALHARSGEEVVEGGGKVLAPGFIDTHSHHDLGLDQHPHAEPLLAQGVTTIVAGQDGDATGPLEKPEPLASVIAWRRAHPAAVNVAYYAGHNTIRTRVMGKRADRPATPTEIGQMQALLRADMAAGALGLSTGLEYDPGHWSSREEVLALAEEAATHGGRYISHMRNEDDVLDTAVDELLEIGRRTRMPVQISHFKLGGKQVWGTAPAFLARLDQAIAQGVNVSADVYPYDRWYTSIISIFPRRDFEKREATAYVLDRLVPPDGITIVSYRPDPRLQGQTLASVAQARGEDPVTTLISLLRSSGGVKSDLTVIGRSMRQEDVDALITWPQANISSDGLLYGQHPRGAGAFARILRDDVRQRHLLTLPAAVRKMSGLAADHLGLHDRGYIRVGSKADLALFDPGKVADEASFEHPARLAVGVERVWVNGVLVWSGTKATTALPGRFLPRQDQKRWR